MENPITPLVYKVKTPELHADLIISACYESLVFSVITVDGYMRNDIIRKRIPLTDIISLLSLIQSGSDDVTPINGKTNFLYQGMSKLNAFRLMYGGAFDIIISEKKYFIEEVSKMIRNINNYDLCKGKIRPIPGSNDFQIYLDNGILKLGVLDDVYTFIDFKLAYEFVEDIHKLLTDKTLQYIYMNQYFNMNNVIRCTLIEKLLIVDTKYYPLSAGIVRILTECPTNIIKKIEVLENHLLMK